MPVRYSNTNTKIWAVRYSTSLPSHFGSTSWKKVRESWGLYGCPSSHTRFQSGDSFGNIASRLCGSCWQLTVVSAALSSLDSDSDVDILKVLTIIQKHFANKLKSRLIPSNFVFSRSIPNFAPPDLTNSFAVHLRNILDARFAIELCQFAVHSPTPYSVLQYSTVNCSKHSMFENSKWCKSSSSIFHRSCSDLIRNLYILPPVRDQNLLDRRIQWCVAYLFFCQKSSLKH